MPDVSENASFCPRKKCKKKSRQSAKLSLRYDDVDCMCRRRRPHALIHPCTEEERENTHHLTELDGRLAHLIPNPDRDLKYKREEKSVSCMLLF